MDNLEGKTAVVTGAGSGMGRAMALRFARAGMNVVLADVNDDAMGAVAAEAGELGAQALTQHTDIADLVANADLLDAAVDGFGQVNVVCLNAGVTGSAGLSWTLSADDWSWSLGILLDGVIHGVRTFVPHLVEHGDGHVVTTASIAGHIAGVYAAPYMVAKHGVASLSESLYHELKADGSSVGVTCLCPGFVNTNIVQAARERGAEAGAAQDAAGEKWLDMSGRALSGGLDPEVVGDMVHDAILANQFWLFTDQMWDDAIAKRADAILNRQSPVMGMPTRA
ncbi:MAG: SDR family NAD(P)-dependent oxidoreductase [Actinomycetia bacterium]|nr:SDR family NAD(P)-dependent oxidoreductase [Actinomycetes bacterium]